MNLSVMKKGTILRLSADWLASLRVGLPQNATLLRLKGYDLSQLEPDDRDETRSITIPAKTELLMEDVGSRYVGFRVIASGDQDVLPPKGVKGGWVRFIVPMKNTELMQGEFLREVRGGYFQAKVHQWCRYCFGDFVATDRAERNHRFLEEALELTQSLGCTREEAHQLVDYVFDRPVGEPAQEVGGVMVTLAALCAAHQDLDMEMDGEREYQRITQPEIMEKIRKKQASKPKSSPLPGKGEAA